MWKQNIVWVLTPSRLHAHYEHSISSWLDTHKYCIYSCQTHLHHCWSVEMPEEELKGLPRTRPHRQDWEHSYVSSNLRKDIDFIESIKHPSVLNTTCSMQKTFSNVLSIPVHPKYSQSHWMLSQWKEQIHYLTKLSEWPTRITWGLCQMALH